MIQTDNTSTTEMRPEPTRNATSAMSPDTGISTTREDASLNYSTTLDTSNQPTAGSSWTSKLTTEAGQPGYPTSSRTTHTAGASRPGATPNSNGDIFANSGGRQTAKQKVTTAGVAIGAISGSALLGAAMFLFSSWYGKRRRYRRASETSSSQSSMDIRRAGLSDERLMHRN